MKTLTIAAFFILSLSACHYGQNEAGETLERNEQYKTEKTDYSVNKAGEYGSQQSAEKVVLDTTAAHNHTDSSATH